MTVHLGRHRIRQGNLEQFVEEWRTAVVPLRQTFGFSFLGARSLPESSELVFVVRYDGDFDVANRDYYDSEERNQLTPDPARFIEEAVTSVVNVVL